MPDAIATTFFRSSHDRVGIRWAGPWSNLALRMTRHSEGAKDGPALTCCTFREGQTRGSAAVAARTLVALDIETNPRTGEVPPPMSEVATQLAMERQAASLWTTHSHTPDAPRYRVLLPLDAPLDNLGELDPYIARAVASRIMLIGVCDASKFGAASLFFLPRHPPGSSSHAAQTISGTPLNGAMLLTVAMTLTQNAAMIDAERTALRASRTLDPGIKAVIENYNAAHPIAERLTAYGYRREGGRWRSRYQHGIGATVILPDGSRWISFSDSDAVNGVGHKPTRETSPCACFGDSFALRTHYEYSGSFRASIEALRREFINAQNCTEHDW